MTAALVSMIDDVLFDKIESIARQIRNTSKPFGGIQARTLLAFSLEYGV